MSNNSNQTKSASRKRSDQTRYLVQLSLLVAIQIVLTATPLGFLPLGPVHITLVHIPVLIGAITMGPKAGGILGFVFGLSSMITATMRGTPDSIVFSPFLSKSLWSVVIAIVPRVLFGLFAAWIFKALVRTKKVPLPLAAGISAGVGTILHTVMVLGSIYLFLGRMYAQLMNVAYETLLIAFGAVVVTNGLVEAAAAILVCAPLARPLQIVQQQSQKPKESK